MALIVEDGSGIDDADSYINLADARSIAINYGISISDDDVIAEVQLRGAYDYLTARYELLLQGSRTHENQTGCFPRVNMYDPNLSTIPAIDSETIFTDIKKSQVYAASYTNSGTALLLNQETTGSGDLASFEVVGVYKESYQESGSNGTYTLKSSTIDGLLSRYLQSTLNRVTNGGGLFKQEMGFLG